MACNRSSRTLPYSLAVRALWKTVRALPPPTPRQTKESTRTEREGECCRFCRPQEDERWLAVNSLAPTSSPPPPQQLLCCVFALRDGVSSLLNSQMNDDEQMKGVSSTEKECKQLVMRTAHLHDAIRLVPFAMTQRVARSGDCK